MLFVKLKPSQLVHYFIVTNIFVFKTNVGRNSKKGNHK